MSINPEAAPIRTRRLELVALTAGFAEAIVAGDLPTAAHGLRVDLGGWFAADPSHIVQLRLAADAAAAAGFGGVARVIALCRGNHRRAIGSIGLHWPPDDAGRLEVSCRVHPVHRGRGYGAEATAALLDWATADLHVTRFLLAVPSRRQVRDLVPIEIASRRAEGDDARIEALTDLLEGELPR